MWEDCWHSQSGPLMENLIKPLNDNLYQRRVSDFVTRNGNWDRGVLQEFLPIQIVDQIARFPPPRVVHSKDSFSWKPSSDGIFTSSSAYLAVKHSVHTPPHNFDLVWKWPGAERVKLFLWKAIRGSLLTNSERNRRHMSDHSLCPICGGYEETLLHTFRDCNRISILWNCLQVNQIGNFFNSDNWNYWLQQNLNRKKNLQKPEWVLTFGIVLDNIWRAQNDYVFNNKSVSFRTLLCVANNQIQSSIQSKLMFNSLNPLSRNRDRFAACSWSAPPIGWVSVTTDAAVRDGGLLAGCGGLIRDHSGDFVAGFGSKLASCSVLVGELNALFFGLELAVRKSFTKLIMESDSFDAVRIIEDSPPTTQPLSSIIDGIKSLVGDTILVKWSKIPRDFNLVADSLAKNSLYSSSNFVIYETIPSFIQLLVNEDKEGLITM